MSGRAVVYLAVLSPIGMFVITVGLLVGNGVLAIAGVAWIFVALMGLDLRARANERDQARLNLANKKAARVHEHPAAVTHKELDPRG